MNWYPLDSVKELMKRNTPYWVALHVKNNFPTGKYFYLVAGITQCIDLYVPDSSGNYRVSKYGYSIPGSRKEYSEPVNEVVGLYLAAGEGKMLYFRIKSELNLKLSPLFKVYELNEYRTYICEGNFLQGIFHGLVWMMIIYALFLYINIRDRIYLFFILYSFCFSVALFVLLGYPQYYFFPGIAFHVLHSELILQVGSIFYMFLFASIVDLKNLSPRSFKFLKHFIIFAITGVAATSTLLFINFYWYNLISQVSVFIDLVVFLWLICFLFKNRTPITRYVFIGNLCLVAGALVIVVSLLFLHQPFLKYFPVFQAGVSLDLLFFTLALSKRYQFVEQQKRMVDKQLIEQLQIRDQLQAQLNMELGKEVQERTQEINLSREEIIQQREYIEAKSQLLEVYNKQLTDSLKYAGFIQKALLQDITKIKDNFHDALLIYMPQSYVSGDFYMFYKLDDKRSLIIIADCTGHGVPGAMLTLIAQEFIDEIVTSLHIESPADVLGELEEKMSQKFTNASLNESLNEGLDIGIALLDTGDMILHFSGARIPLLQLRDGTVSKIRGNLYGIGGFNYKNKPKQFTLHAIDIQPGDIYFMFTDGYQDQLKQHSKVKYLSTRFMNFLLNNSHVELNKLEDVLIKEHFDWRGDSHQTDDILIFGFKINPGQCQV